MGFVCTETSLKDAFNNNKNTIDLSKNISKELIEKNIDIIQFIEYLGFALTSTDVELRVKGIRILTETLLYLPENFLNEVQLNFIITFFCDRLKDHHSVIPALLTGIISILQMKCIPTDKISKLIMALFNNVPCQSQVREDREKIFHILKIVSESYETELLPMGSDFVYGVINAIDGERDPCILLSLFEFIPSFIKTYPLKHLADEMFEVCACYFPVDYHPSPNNPAALTRNVLADKLALCLCATTEFTENCLNLILEKIDSQLNIAKIDSLNLLFKCTENFKIESIEKHFDTIWGCLKVELLPGSSAEIVFISLKTLEQIIKCAAQANEMICNNMLTIIFGSTMTPLSDVNARLFTPSTAIALICCRASGYSCTVITNKLLPLFLMQLETQRDSVTQKCTLIDLIMRLLILSIEHNVIDTIENNNVENSIQEFINCLNSNQTNNNDNKELTEIGLKSLTKLSKIVIEKYRFIIYKTINDHLNDGNSNINIKLILYEYAKNYPLEVKDSIVLNRLNLELINEDLKITEYIFDSFIMLVNIKEFHQIILNFLLKNIFHMASDQPNIVQILALKYLKQLMDNSLTITATTTTTTTTLSSEIKENNNIALELYTDYNIIPELVKFANFTKNCNANDEDNILLDTANILRMIIKSLDISVQKIIVQTYLQDLNLAQKPNLYIAFGILGNLDKDVDIKDIFEHLVNELTKLALTHDNEKLVNIAHELLCSLFNRMPPNDETHNNVLKKIVNYLKKEIHKHNKNAVKVLTWISKGLLISGHPDASELIDTIIELITHPTLGHVASLAFEILSLELPGLHLPAVKHLFQQKFFHYILKKIVNFSENHLTAFAFVLKMVPHVVLKMNIDKIGPILFKCLTIKANSTTTPSTTPIEISLEIIEKFVQSQDEYFCNHLHHLIPSCIELCKFKDSMIIRITAIRCLQEITKYPVAILMPFKQDVVYGLLVPLDDPKRLVRNTAVVARNLWFLIGTPIDDDK